jgi:hypothetical protein
LVFGVRCPIVNRSSHSTVFTGLVTIACSTSLYGAKPELSNPSSAIVDSQEVGLVPEPMSEFMT